LLRPGSESLLAPEWLGKKGELVFQGLYRAGQELVEEGKVSAEAEEIIRQPWTQNRQGFQEQANLFWKVRIEHAERSRRGEETRPFEEAVREDIRILLGGMAVRMRRELTGDLRATIQFEVSGKQPGQWYFDIQDGICAFKEGRADHPNLTIHSPSEVWVAVALGRTDGAKAFLEKKYTAEGDLSLLMGFKNFFGQE
ncbi:MAG TPA: SCP2 sterol-binding domain-containing protein, partial [Thermodesulfobacteriota bacterium]